MNITNSRSKSVKKGIAWAAVEFLLSTLLPFVVRALFVRKLGNELLGLNSLCTSILNVLNVVDFGLTDAMTFTLYEPVFQRDIKKINQLYTYFNKLFRLIGFVIFCIGIIVIPFFDHFYSDSYLSINARIVFGVYLLNVVISYLFFSKRVLLFNAIQRTDLIHKAVSVGYLILYPMQIIMIINKKYYGYLFIFILASIAQIFISKCFERKYYSDYSVDNTLSKEEKTKILFGSSNIAIFKFRDISRNSFDSIVISFFGGLSVLANYQNYLIILNVIIVVCTVILKDITPSYGNYYYENGKDATYNLSKTILLLQLFLSGWFSLFYLFCIDDFIAFWLGTQYVMSTIYSVLLIIYFYFLGISGFTNLIRQSLGIWDKGRRFAFIEMIANLLFNVVFVYFWGVPGAILSTIFTIVIFNIPCDFNVLITRFFQKCLSEYIRLMLKSVIWILLSWIIVYSIIHFISISFIMKVVLKLFVCAFIPPIMFIVIYYRDKEYKALIKIIKRVL